MMEIKGIDVSVFQGAIDWKRVKADGVSAAIIKAAQGRAESSNSYLFTDSRFDANIRNAKKAGIKYIGTYYYFTAKNDRESAREAAHYISVIKPYSQYINVFAAVDVESKHLNGMSRAALTSAVNVFYKAVEAAGFPCAVYTNPDFIKNRFDLDGAHRLWLALWRSKSMKPVGYTNMCMWQWGASAVDGIKGNVDSNFCYFVDVQDKPAMPPQTVTPSRDTIKAGAKVRVENPVIYGTSKRFKLYHNVYDVISVSGDRAVIGIGNAVTAAVDIDYLAIV